MVVVEEAYELGQEDKGPVIDPNHHGKDLVLPNGKDNVGKAFAIMAVGAAIGAATLIWVKPDEEYRIFLLSIGGVIAGRGLVELLL